jgi:hypothetical protein
MSDTLELSCLVTNGRILEDCRHVGTITRYDMTGRTTCSACGVVFPPPVVFLCEFDEALRRGTSSSFFCGTQSSTE